MAAWIRQNTVTVTSGSATVTGASTAFLTMVRPGYVFTVDNSIFYEVISVDSNTQITLDRAYVGSTAAGLAYAIVPVFSSSAEAATNLAALAAGLLSTYGAALLLTGSNREVVLDKTTSGALARLLLKQGGVQQFDLGLVGDNNFRLRRSTDGLTWLDALVVDKTTGGIKFSAHEVNVASAATCDIGAAAGLKVNITGTTTITSWGTVAHALRFIRFAGALTLTHNATSLILPGSANITTAAGDMALATSDASGNWVVRHYQKNTGNDGIQPRWGLISAGTRRLVDAFTTEPRRTRSFLLDDLINALIDGGVWSILDGLYVAGANAQATLINIKNPGTYNATAVNAPTFTADRGYTGDGVSSHLDTNFPASTASSPQYQLNSAHLGVWRRGSAQEDRYEISTISDTTARIRARSSADSCMLRINDASDLSATITDGKGHTLVNRSGASARQAYKNGSSIASDTQASTSVPASNLVVLRNLTQYGTQQIAAIHWGGSLTSGQVTTLYNALNTYLTAIGAAP